MRGDSVAIWKPLLFKVGICLIIFFVPDFYNGSKPFRGFSSSNLIWKKDSWINHIAKAYITYMVEK